MRYAWNNLIRMFEFPPEVVDVIELLKCDSFVRSIWLVGSRANKADNENSDWDFIAFTSQKTACPVEMKAEGIDVIRVGLDGSALLEGANSYMEHKFDMWEWKRVSGTEAVYVGKRFVDYPEGHSREDHEPVYKKTQCRSYRIWERNQER